jgi:hypothetical protein
MAKRPAHNAKPIGSKYLCPTTGYVYIKTVNGQAHWPPEHRVVWEAANGPLQPGQTIHHLNEIKTDNRLENLRLCDSEAEHQRRYHLAELVARNKRGMSPESIAKMAASKRGKALSAEHRAKIGAAATGRFHSELTKQRIGDAHRGKAVSAETRAKISAIKKGFKHTEATKKAIGAASRGRPISAETHERMNAAQQRRAAERRAANS